MQLRDYQESSVSSITDLFKNGTRSVLMVQPTGTGKTVQFITLADRWARGRVLILAHREELIYQAVETCKRITSFTPAVEMADDRSTQRELWIEPERFVIATVQTLSRPHRLQRFNPDHYGMVIVDEAHHSPAKSYIKILDHFKQNSECRILGVTATPDRLDRKRLGSIYDAVGFDYQLSDAIDDGWLVPIVQKYVTITDLDFSNVNTVKGDFSPGELDTVMRSERIIHEVAKPTIESAGNRPTLIFTTSVAHAHQVAEVINRYKGSVAAVALDGKSDKQERRTIVSQFKAGRIQFLCNCGLFLEGFDAPLVACVSVARPTKSRALYAQMVGRGTRPQNGLLDGDTNVLATGRRELIGNSGKPDLLVLDFVGNSGKHKLISTVDIFCEDDEEQVKEIVQQRLFEKGFGDAREEIAAAKVQLQDEEENRQRAEEEQREKLRSRVRANVRFSVREIDPFSILDLAPSRDAGWYRYQPASNKQKECIRKMTKKGVPETTLSTINRKDATRMIGQLITNRRLGKATFRQKNILAKFGMDTDQSFTGASALITKLASNDWKRI